MTIFSYVGRNASGSLVRGELDATSAGSVAQSLLKEGISPVNIVPKPRSNPLFSSIFQWRSQAIPDEAFLMFCRQMQALLNAGVPILDAISKLSDIVPIPYFSGILKEIEKKLMTGETLSNAMKHYPKVFSFMIISLVAAGESNGRLDQAFLQAGKHYELEITTRRRVKAAFRYPIFVMLTICLAIIVINVFVIPRFASLYSSFSTQLPMPTRVLIFTSNVMRQHWKYLLIICVVCYLMIHYCLKKPSVRMLRDHYQLKLPVLGKILEQLVMASFTQSLAMLLQTGVPLIQALSLSADVVNNAYAKNKILSIGEKIERGESLTEAATSVRFFSPLVLQMMSVGEKTGNVDKMLFEVSKFYEQEIDNDISQLTSRLEPLLLIAVGGIVLLLALGVFLPMWDMVNFVK